MYKQLIFGSDLLHSVKHKTSDRINLCENTL